MKLTEHKKQWVHSRIREYCKSMKVVPPSWLFLTQKDWKQWAVYIKEQTGQKKYRQSDSNCLGVCCYKRKVIAIFVKRFETLKRLDQTIRHELVHYVRRYNHHSKEFHRCMEQLRKGELTA